MTTNTSDSPRGTSRLCGVASPCDCSWGTPVTTPSSWGRRRASSARSSRRRRSALRRGCCHVTSAASGGKATGPSRLVAIACPSNSDGRNCPAEDGGPGHPHVQPPEQPSSPGEALGVPGRIIDVDILQDEQQPLVAEVDDAVHHREAQARGQPVPEVREVEIHLLTPPPTTKRVQGVSRLDWQQRPPRPMPVRLHDLAKADHPGPRSRPRPPVPSASRARIQPVQTRVPSSPPLARRRMEPG